MVPLMKTHRTIGDLEFPFGLARDYVLHSDWLEFVSDHK